MWAEASSKQRTSQNTDPMLGGLNNAKHDLGNIKLNQRNGGNSVGYPIYLAWEKKKKSSYSFYWWGYAAYTL